MLSSVDRNEDSDTSSVKFNVAWSIYIFVQGLLIIDRTVKHFCFRWPNRGWQAEKSGAQRFILESLYDVYGAELRHYHRLQL